MSDIRTAFSDIMNKRLVTASPPNRIKGPMYTIVNDFSKIDQAIGNAAYTALYAMTEPRNVDNLAKSIQTSVKRRFYPFVNNEARLDPKSFWHLYDGQHIGETRYSLFDFISTKSTNGRFNMAIVFKPSTMIIPVRGAAAIPGPTGKVVQARSRFYNKAMVMEYGLPTRIAPIKGKFLVFEGRNNFLVFMGPRKDGTAPAVTIDRSKSSTVGSLRRTVDRFFISGTAENIVRMAGNKYAEEVRRVSEKAATYDLTVTMASDSKARAIGRMLAEEIRAVQV